MAFLTYILFSGIHNQISLNLVSNYLALPSSPAGTEFKLGVLTRETNKKAVEVDLGKLVLGRMTRKGLFLTKVLTGI